MAPNIQSLWKSSEVNSFEFLNAREINMGSTPLLKKHVQRIYLLHIFFRKHCSSTGAMALPLYVLWLQKNLVQIPHNIYGSPSVHFCKQPWTSVAVVCLPLLLHNKRFMEANKCVASNGVGGYVVHQLNFTDHEPVKNWKEMTGLKLQNLIQNHMWN